MAKRTGKTYENLENQITPPPTPPPTVTRARPARGERSGPIGISGGDFVTPTARKRTITQPRGMPVVRVLPEEHVVLPPAAPIDDAQLESPFAAATSADLGDAASYLAAQAAAVRALDSGPLTPRPSLDDPGPTPPPIASETPPPPVEYVPAPVPAFALEPIALDVTPVIGLPEPSPRVPSELEPTGPFEEFPAASPSFVERTPELAPAIDDVDLASEEASFAAHETPWPELATGAISPTTTPVPGAIPDVGSTDDLEVEDAAETLEALPPEVLAEAMPVAPRVPPAPPPIPPGPSRRKTAEMRPPEVPAAQVVASIVLPASDAPALPEALAPRPRRPKRSKPWFEEVFDEDYLRTLPFMSPDQTLREVEFIEASLALQPGARVLDVGCGYGRHAIELVQRGLDVTGLDLSLPLLIRAADESQRRAMSVNFVHADMRQMAFEHQFDGAYCMLTSFGYFDDEANLKVAEVVGRALKPGARFLLDLVYREYIVGDLPSRVWWEGNGCVVLEEVDFNFHTSRIMTHRSIVFEDGRQLEQEISVRAYSLHEIGRLLRQAGFRVLDISGGLATRGHFFGQTSRNLLVLAEKRADDA